MCLDNGKGERKKLLANIEASASAATTLLKVDKDRRAHSKLKA